VNLRNADGLRIGEADIWLDVDPAVLEVQAVDGSPFAAGYTWALTETAISTATSRVRVRYSVTDGVFPPQLFGSGSLVRVTFLVNGSAGEKSRLDLKELVRPVGGTTLYSLNPATGDLLNGPLELVDGVLVVDQGSSGDAPLGVVGDADGDGIVDQDDALAALDFAVGSRTPVPSDLDMLDVNGDGKISSADAVLVLHYALHGQWPAQSAQVGSAMTTTVAFADTLGVPGTTVSTTLQALDLADVAGGDFTMAYDPTVILEVSSVVAGSALPVPVLVASHDWMPGVTKIAFAAAAGLEGDAELLGVRLALSDDVRDERTSVALLSADLADGLGRDFTESGPNHVIVRKHGQIHFSGSHRLFVPIIAGPAN
jgi:hypothetical protein